ncbi:ABC transporter permease [Herbiconiux ginsengi]|uniref:Peptide/nickel transport system permease protein n=1 Tax=Herbiconiux ginsengi TaxID=381665 RepID=A0A1H3TEA9_9MICO|nr:ABC transporter permease [Herbiconiux ginsengi]SDZ48208.1 peptide/nickel transport system permease protein [Herbiconiux ginsengi]
MIETTSVGEKTAAPQGSALQRSPRKPRLPGVVAVLIRRLLWAIPLILVVTAFSFVLVSLTPGDPAREMLGIDASEEAYLALRSQLGLDRPVWEQYISWLLNALQGNLGTSIYTGGSVSEAIAARMPVTISLVVASLLLSLIIGMIVGVYSAARGGWSGKLVDSLALVGFALPTVWVGALLIGLFAVRFRWLPASGYVPFAEDPMAWLLCLVLPVTALATHAVAAISKQTREAMLDVLGSEHIRMARANGVGEVSLVLRHSLKNAGLRISTVLGLQAIGLLGGTVLVESVFGLPGLGGLAVEASRRHDLPVIQGIVLVFTVFVVLINVAIDLAYSWLNPRVSAR